MACVLASFRPFIGGFRWRCQSASSVNKSSQSSRCQLLINVRKRMPHLGTRLFDGGLSQSIRICASLDDRVPSDLPVVPFGCHQSHQRLAAG